MISVIFMNIHESLDTVMAMRGLISVMALIYCVACDFSEAHDGFMTVMSVMALKMSCP
jgi:hypothetical protein